jgi:hypothetical protein
MVPCGLDGDDETAIIVANDFHTSTVPEEPARLVAVSFGHETITRLTRPLPGPCQVA